MKNLLGDILSGEGIIDDDWRKTKNWEKAKEEFGISDEVIESVVSIGEKYHTASEQAEALQKQMNGLRGVGSRLIGVFKSIGTTILNGIASYAISYGISKLVSGIKSIWDELSGATERRLQNNAIKKMTQDISELKEKSESLDDVTKRFEELKKKTEDTNITVEELLKTKQELAELQDTLPAKYQQEFEGIDLVNGGLEEQLELLKEIEKQNADDFLYGENGALFKKDKHGKTEAQRAYEQIYKKPSKDNFDYLETQNLFSVRGNKGIRNINDYYGFDIASILKKNGIGYYAGTKDQAGNFKYIEDELLDNLPDYGEDKAISFYLEFDEDATSKEISEAITKVRAEISQKYNDNEKANDFLNYIGNIKTGYNAEKYATSQEYLKTVAQQYMLSTGVNYEEEANEVEKAYAEALATYQKDASDANKEAFDEAARRLDEVKDSVDNYVAGISDTYVTEGMTNLFDSIWDTKPLTSNEKLQKYFGDRMNGFIQIAGELSEREKQVILSMLDGIDVENLVMDDIIKIVAEAKAYVENNPINIEVGVKASAAVDSMADMKSAVASLSDLYNQSVLQAASENADNFATFAADPATLNSIESAFSKFIEEKSSSGSDVSELNDALDNFEKTAVEAFGDDDYAEQMQDAINRLITSYIDQTDVIKNLTEENKEWSVAQLKAMGITNALDVVEDRLTKVNQKLSKSYSKLTDSITAYKDAVSRNDEEAQQSSLEDITNELNSVYDYTDSKGNKIQVFDTEYVKANLEAISTAIENTTDKYDDLDKMASKQYIAKLKEEVDDTNLRAKFVWLEDAMMRLDGSQLEIGASMDDTEVIRALNNIYATGKYTVEEFQKMVSQISGGTISATPGWDWIDTGAEMEVPDFSNQHGWGSSSVTPKKVTVKLKQRLPKFTYEYKSKGSAGRLANYSAPSGGGSSGGGGGGGGGSEPTQPKEESEETFDWIEVAIQRIEEEISRLDKVVGNSYDLWINRNEALVKEMEKTTEEIKAQQLAQSEYLRNANAVQVNNGKGLNDDDYGENDELVKANDQKLLDEARAAWATGEYQRKVREGQMSGDDIEKIQNHFLSETIQFYQEL